MAEQPSSLSIRERLEAVEEAVLSPYASHSARTAGRERPEPESPVRTAYQRDRDRIIHCNAFRRLRGKTQVFLAPAGDHYATRLSHALEVAQVARDLARALRLNEDLAEAIALAHDLGHAPFGHSGQTALNELLGGGYQHDRQSLRVVRDLEKDGRGLNLTAEVIDGIRTHRKPRHSMAATVEGPSCTLEAEVVRLSDGIAYINHDVDDAIRAGIIDRTSLPDAPIRRLGRSRSERINTVVCDIIETSEGQARVAVSPDVLLALNELRDYLFDHVYTNSIVKREDARARGVVARLFEHYVAHPDALPESFRQDPRNEGIERRVADYIAGMTDAFAISTFSDLFVPKMWPIRA
jgi:dGTPase